MARKITHEDFLKRLYLVKDKNEFEVLSIYRKQQVKVKFKHLKCGTIFEATPNNMCKKDYGGCPICGNLSRAATKRKDSPININTIELKIKELYPNFEYTLEPKSFYINNKKPTIFLKCSRCDNVFPISYVNLCKFRGCPICNRIRRQESKNIKKIKNFLIEEKINFTEEYAFSDCKNIRPLRFDIAIKKNSELYLIEYDGEQHDKPFNNNYKNLERCRKNDAIKNKYCTDNNIKFLRLRYNDFDNYKEKIINFLK